MTHAAESTHFYTREGKPAYTVKAKAGHDRPTTLADARKLALVPSVTTILQCAAKPALERWKRDQMMLAALTLPRLEGEAEADWLKRVEHDSRETGRKAAERGTAIHAAIQGHFEGQKTLGFEPHIQGAVKALSGWVGTDVYLKTDWWAEKSFAHPMGYGGKLDLSASGLVADFKTKEFDEDSDLKTWDEHAMQLAAYRMGLGMPQARGAIVYVSVTKPGLARLIEIPEADLVKGWKCFYSLLQFWKASKGYECGFERELAATGGIFNRSTLACRRLCTATSSASSATKSSSQCWRPK